MAIDVPPPKRRASGFRRVRTAHDLQPRVDAPPTGRRMGGDGQYLSPLRQLTTNILETYHICNPAFRYESTLNPRRVLTKPSKPAHNDGYDNDDYDYILYVNDWLGTEEGHKYLILDILGQGTFGQVVKCQNMKTHEIVAVKIVKNKPAYFNQSMMEVTILELLNKTCDPNDEHHILRLRDSFIHRSHLCLVFELLSSNLYELIKQNQFQGLSTQLVKVFMAQLLDALTILKEARLIHCDLKPENILLKSLQSPQIKVIDFGSACHERQTVYTYIQSRFYRSPEVLLGMSYTAAIDMWSLGCIAVELFLGLPLFPGTSEYNQLTRIIDMLGLPPLSMLNTGKQTAQFFDSYEVFNPHLNQNEKKYRIKSMEQYSREHNTNEQPGKQYFKATSLPEIINTAPMPTSKSSRQAHEIDKEVNNRAAFIDFCQGLLNLNPVTRWTPQQARLHPFITGEKFTKPFVPDGITLSQHHNPTSGAPADPKRPYGGLVPSQPKGTRAFQDAASYNHHLAQHQAYTAQAQAQSQAATAYRNPYITPQVQQQQQQSPAASNFSGAPEAHVTYQQQQQQHSQYSTPSQPTSGHRLTHQSSTGQLATTGSAGQYSGHPSTAAIANAHLNPNVPSNSYYPNSRARANTINQMSDNVPPALARLQHMNQDVIAGRNALTPVLNRDDAMREWERRQSGKPAAAQPYPQLEYLQQQAEMAASSGLTNWTNANAHNRYPPPPSKLSHAYQPQTIIVDDDNSRRDAVMSNVRTVARSDGPNTMYANTGVISSPPQVYSNNPPAGNRYPASYTQPQQQQQQPQQPQQQQQSTASPFDSLDRRTDIGNMFVPMQPDQYQSYQAAPSTPRHGPPSGQPVQQQSFYGAGIVSSGQPGGGQQPQRNPFVADGSQQPLGGVKDVRRGNGMDVWPR
ncbi:kinase-like domain-containing protein [Crucibulum laeve]|uniref:Kinase-like domain-containing protein n=1 Tax=Crucibulum laeve TaxID=68775 RepID=A0A5C3MI62_9AGAR|nr:kinase-like domain-containing protein [Crucibulum laeve]